MTVLNLMAWGFLAVLVSRCNGHTFKMSECPKVQVMKEFDMEKFSGVWYVQQRFHPLCTCIKINITKGAENTFKIEESGRPFGIPLSFYPFVRKPRQIKFLSNETESIFKVHTKFGPLDPATYGVVSTDYDRYALMWGCDPVLFGSVQDVNVLTREPQADPDLIKTAKEKMEEFDVDLRSLEKVDQNRCLSADSSDNGSFKYNNMVIGS